MIRVLLVDDHQLVRRGLAQLVHDTPGMEVAGEAGDGEGALDVLRSTQPDVVVLDLSMPGRGGLDVLQELRTQSPGSRVIILTMYPEEQYAIRSFREGAAAYLTKASAPEELIQAIRTVAAGKRYITPSVADRLATWLEDGDQRLPHESLSSRELQVLMRIGAGKEVKEVAGELNLSIKTVSTYRARILQKMNLATNAQLIRYAIQHRLVE